MSTGAPPAQKPHGAESISTGTIPVRLPVQENSTGNSTRMPERSRGVLPLTGESARGLRRQKSSQRLDVRDILKPANHLDGGLSFVCRPLCEFCAIFGLAGLPLAKSAIPVIVRPFLRWIVMYVLILSSPAASDRGSTTMWIRFIMLWTSGLLTTLSSNWFNPALSKSSKDAMQNSMLNLAWSAVCGS